MTNERSNVEAPPSGGAPAPVTIGALAHAIDHAPTRAEGLNVGRAGLRARRADRGMALGTFVRLANGRKRSIPPTA